MLGMHRAGTSVVTRVVDLLGVPAAREPSLKPPTGANPAGLWEVPELTALNDRILAELGGAWSAPPDSLEPRKDGAVLEPVAGTARSRFAHAHPGPQWVWKDPRTCLTLPFWIEALQAHSVVILVHRDPLEVAASLHDRDGFSKTFGLALWERYMRDALRAGAGLPAFVVRYADLLDRPVPTAADLASFLGEEGFAVHDPDGDQIGGCIDQRIRRHKSDPRELDRDPEVSESQRRLCRLLDGLAGSHAALPALALPAMTPLTAPLLREVRQLMRLRNEAEDRHTVTKRRGKQLKERLVEAMSSRQRLSEELERERNEATDVRARLEAVERTRWWRARLGLLALANRGRALAGRAVAGHLRSGSRR